MIKRIKKSAGTIISKTKGKINLFFSEKVYISYGENCLTDNILQRHLLKSLTTAFSHGRSNIEYILQLEKDNYKDFVNPQFLKYEDLNGKNVTRLKKYDQIQNDYNELHKNGVEFTHHDLIKHEALRLKMKKRVDVIRKLNGKKKFIIFYHHRANQSTNINLLLQNLNELKQLYSNGKFKAEVICFTQNIITDKENRKVDYKAIEGIHYFVFNTLDEWGGNNNDIFWATCDEDLITQMIVFSKKL